MPFYMTLIVSRWGIFHIVIYTMDLGVKEGKLTRTSYSIDMRSHFLHFMLARPVIGKAWLSLFGPLVDRRQLEQDTEPHVLLLQGFVRGYCGPVSIVISVLYSGKGTVYTLK